MINYANASLVLTAVAVSLSLQSMLILHERSSNRKHTENCIICRRFDTVLELDPPGTYIMSHIFVEKNVLRSATKPASIINLSGGHQAAPVRVDLPGI